MLPKQVLNDTFRKARETHSPFVFVLVEAEGTREVICIPADSFDDKEKFYNRSYTDDLVHVMNKNVFIKGLSYGESEELDHMD